MRYCGIDFGTSNSSVGILSSGEPVLVRFSNDSETTPSAVFYGSEADVQFGHSALNCYTDGLNGRLLRALKSVLGTSLIDEDTVLGNRRVAFRSVVSEYLNYLKTTLEEATS